MFGRADVLGDRLWPLDRRDGTRWCRARWPPPTCWPSSGIEPRVLNVSTIKPLDEAAIVAAACETGAIVTVEEAMIEGGLGAAVAEIVVRNAPVPMRLLGVKGFAPTGKSRVPVRSFRAQSRRHRRRGART